MTGFKVHNITQRPEADIRQSDILWSDAFSAAADVLTKRETASYLCHALERVLGVAQGTRMREYVEKAIAGTNVLESYIEIYTGCDLLRDALLKLGTTYTKYDCYAVRVEWARDLAEMFRKEGN